MARVTALGDLLSTVLERGARLVDMKGAPDHSALVSLCEKVMTARGEAAGVVLAAEVLAQYRELSAEGRLAFFQHMAAGYNPDPAEVLSAAEAYAGDQSPPTLAALFDTVEPPRQELLRRLNMAPGGTECLVKMRADLLELLREHPELRSIDTDFRHLLGSWFNRGFLVLRRIDWSTPASLLEKIIAYEAVHQIDSWDDLRRRVEPEDRRCFAFFHPSMPDEPLIFVEVALTKEVPGSIQALLAEDRAVLPAGQAKTAAFYSISNCQPGLAGVSFGAFLIKQVARDLTEELPGVETFVTLSPVPGLMRWVSAEAEATPEGDGAEVLLRVVLPDWHEDVGLAEDVRPLLMRLAGRYFLQAKRSDGQPPDPVARFHLGNGAELEAMHWMGDTSANGLAQSAGLMVNYRYRLDRIEENHEAYVASREVKASKALRSLLKGAQ